MVLKTFQIQYSQNRHKSAENLHLVSSVVEQNQELTARKKEVRVAHTLSNKNLNLSFERTWYIITGAPCELWREMQGELPSKSLLSKSRLVTLARPAMLACVGHAKIYPGRDFVTTDPNQRSHFEASMVSTAAGRRCRCGYHAGFEMLTQRALCAGQSARHVRAELARQSRWLRVHHGLVCLSSDTNSHRPSSYAPVRPHSPLDTGSDLARQRLQMSQPRLGGGRNRFGVRHCRASRELDVIQIDLRRHYHIGGRDGACGSWHASWKWRPREVWRLPQRQRAKCAIPATTRCTARL